MDRVDRLSMKFKQYVIIFDENMPTSEQWQFQDTLPYTQSADSKYKQNKNFLLKQSAALEENLRRLKLLGVP